MPNRWFRRTLYGVMSLALAVLITAVVTLGLLYAHANDRAVAQAEAARRQSESNMRLIQEVDALVRQATATANARGAVIDAAIQRILDALRTSIDCTYLRAAGERPRPCIDVNERIDALREGRPITTPPVAPESPVTTTTTTTTSTTIASPAPPMTPPDTVPGGPLCRVPVVGYLLCR